MTTSKFKETAMKIVFLISACVSIIAVVLICVFLFVNGVPAMAEIGFFDFLLGETWRPSSDIYGIMPMILLFWPGCYGALGALHSGRPRDQYAYSLAAAGHNDSAHNNKRERILYPCGAPQLL